jgi:hypothetical protein
MSKRPRDSDDNHDTKKNRHVSFNNKVMLDDGDEISLETLQDFADTIRNLERNINGKNVIKLNPLLAAGPVNWEIIERKDVKYGTKIDLEEYEWPTACRNYYHSGVDIATAKTEASNECNLFGRWDINYVRDNDNNYRIQFYNGAKQLAYVAIIGAGLYLQNTLFRSGGKTRRKNKKCKKSRRRHRRHKK